MLDFLGIGSDQLIESLLETLQMLVTSAVIGAVIAMIIAPILFEAYHSLSFWYILDL